MVHAEGPVRPVAGPTAITEPQASASGSNSTPAAALESSPDATHTTCTTNTSNPVTPSAASTPSGRSCGDEGGVGAVQGKLPWQSNVLGAYLVPQQGAGGSGVHHSQAAEEVESLPPYVCGNDASVQMRINEQLTKQYPCGLVRDEDGALCVLQAEGRPQRSLSRTGRSKTCVLVAGTGCKFLGVGSFFRTHAALDAISDWCTCPPLLLWVEEI